MPRACPSPPSHSCTLTPLQPPRPPCRSLNPPGKLQPQGLCTGSSLCLECFSPPTYPHGSPLTSFKSSILLPHWGLLWPPSLNDVSVPPFSFFHSDRLHVLLLLFLGRVSHWNISFTNAGCLSLFCSLLDSQCLEQCLVHRRRSINVSG